MRQQKIPDPVLHLFVARDQKGHPRQMEIHLVPQNDT